LGKWRLYLGQKFKKSAKKIFVVDNVSIVAVVDKVVGL